MSKRKSPACNVTIDAAFQLLLRKNEPHAACELLNTAIGGRVKLFADGTEVKPSFFIRHVYVATDEVAGGWVARLKMLVAVKMPKEWTVTGIEGLLESKSELPRRRPCPATTHEWHTICGEIAVVATTNLCSVVPKNQSKLAEDVLEWCELKYGMSPAESEMREAVRRVCDQLQQP